MQLFRSAARWGARVGHGPLWLGKLVGLLTIGPAVMTPAGSETDPYVAARAVMVAEQIEARGVKDPAVLKALRAVPRHKFVPARLAPEAYADEPLPIGAGQTISQPYIVAAMTELLHLKTNDIVLEVGTGSGYQAAVLAGIVRHVYTIEIVKALGESAAQRLQELGYTNVTVKVGDGYLGWPDHAPFDAIIVTAAPDHIPQPLIEQLKPGGRLVVPVGTQWSGQDLIVVEKTRDGKIVQQAVMPVRFVPLTGDHQGKP